MYYFQASPTWHEQAKLRGAIRTPYGDLRLFPRHKNENKTKLDGVDGVTEQLNQAGGVGHPHPPAQPKMPAGPSHTPRRSSQGSGPSDYETTKSSMSTEGHKKARKLSSSQLVEQMLATGLGKVPPLVAPKQQPGGKPP